MKTSIQAIAFATVLLGSVVDARRFGGSSRSSRSGGSPRSSPSSRLSRRGPSRSKAISLETIDACAFDIEFSCSTQFDFALADLQADLALGEPLDDIGTSQLGQVGECLSGLKDTLEEGGECLVALESSYRGRGSKRHGGKCIPLETINACAFDIDFACSAGFDFALADLQEDLALIQAAKEEAMELGLPVEPMDDATKDQLSQVRTCLSGLKDTLEEGGQCFAALESHGKPRPGSGDGDEAGAGEQPENNDIDLIDLK